MSFQGAIGIKDSLAAASAWLSQHKNSISHSVDEDSALDNDTDLLEEEFHEDPDEHILPTNFAPTLEALVKHPVFKVLPELANVFSILGNGCAAFVNCFSKSDKLKKTGSNLGKYASRTFFLVNGNINALEQLLKKNYLLAGGYFMENVVMSVVEQSKLFLARGFVSGAYTLGNAFNLMNKKDSFHNLEEHMVHIAKGIKKSWKYFSTNPVENIFSPHTGLLSVISGLMKILGPSVWLTSKNERAGATIRDAANLIQNVEQIKPGHMKDRMNFFLSGVNTTMGTLCDYLSKWLPGAKEVLVPLSLLTDGLGIYFLRRAQNSGELSKAKQD